MWGPVTTSPNTLLVLPWNPQLEPEQQLEPPAGVFPRVASPARNTKASRGGMGEWLKPAVLKTVSLERGSGVRIPLPPPF